jgi:molybdenum cofactor biosynthesis protein B
MGSHHHRRDTIERVGCVVVTASDTRTEADDRSGPVIRRILEAAGHAIVDAVIVPDDAAAIRNAVMTATARPDVGAVFVTGGTGVAARDVTIESLAGTWSKELPGFGEIFRALSFAEIGPAAFLSRATAGVIGNTFVAVLPGSPAACELALGRILVPELGHLVGLLGANTP